jgi:hypothetical protein
MLRQRTSFLAPVLILGLSVQARSQTPLGPPLDLGHDSRGLNWHEGEAQCVQGQDIRAEFVGGLAGTYLIAPIEPIHPLGADAVFESVVRLPSDAGYRPHAPIELVFPRQHVDGLPDVVVDLVDPTQAGDGNPDATVRTLMTAFGFPLPYAVKLGGVWRNLTSVEVVEAGAAAGLLDLQELGLTVTGHPLTGC